MSDAGTTFGKPLGHEQVSSLNTAQTLTVPSGARIAVLRCQTQNVRWRDDATAPTGAVGMLMLPADEPFIYTGDLDAIQFIETAASAVLNVAYYG